MKISDIKRMASSIIQKGHIESDYIECKKSAEFKAKILKTACAYANNYMNRELGLLFIGIEEINNRETGEKAFPSRPIIGIDERVIETTENSLKKLLSEIHPRINYHLILDKMDNRNYIILAVEPGNAGPYQTSDKAWKDKEIALKPGRYIRLKRDTRLPSPREEFELLKKFANYTFSSNLNETATIDDLNYEYMKEYLIATHAKQDIRALSKLDMARSMGLVSESEYGGYRAKNFAVLMFADKPQDFIPYARVEIIREVVGTDKMESKVFDGPIWIQARQVSQYFKDNIMASYTIRDNEKIGHRIIYNWPQEMFSELATNCILHKEYESSNYIGIYVYRDHISFINHNRPLPPVTIEDMNTKREFNDRVYLNPEIKEMFFSLDLIESYGSGIRRAKEAMEKNCSPRLIFEPLKEQGDYTMATAYINEEFAQIQGEENRNLDETKEMTKEITKEMTKEMNAAIKLLMKEKPTISANEIANILNVSAESIRYRIKIMKKVGEIQRKGSTKKGEWIIMT